MHDELKRHVTEHGRNAFGPSWYVDGWSFAPGRIELIGNHIDYNGGLVLAAAIERVIAIGSGPITEAREIAMVASDISPDVESFEPLTIGDWRASASDSGPLVYVKGVCAALLGRGIPIRTGVGLSVEGTIPPGFGMSSSAALCLATILSLTVDELDPYEMVAIAREAEHRAGSPVGAMDQSASVAGDVIVFDGHDSSYRIITANLGEYVFAVADSGVDRSLRTSSYGVRVKEAEEARRILATACGVDLPSLAAFEVYWDDAHSTLDEHLSPILLKRTRHVVTETRRVREAEVALHNNDWVRFGEFMNASGESSTRDYEISHPVVEELVATLREIDGVLGARMMGGGEGGPALVLLRRDAVDDVSAALDQSFYRRHTKRQAEPFQVCRFGPGARRETA